MILKNHLDISNTHNIIIDQTKGYSTLNMDSKTLFDTFIVNFFNAWSLESRNSLKLLWVGYVDHIEYQVKELFEDEYEWTAVGSINYILTTSGKSIHEHDLSEEYNNQIEDINTVSQNYLRFEYEMNGKNSLLHVEKKMSGIKLL